MEHGSDYNGSLLVIIIIQHLSNKEGIWIKLSASDVRFLSLAYDAMGVWLSLWSMSLYQYM